MTPSANNSADRTAAAHYVLAITGASGAAYAVRLLDVLVAALALLAASGTRAAPWLFADALMRLQALK